MVVGKASTTRRVDGIARALALLMLVAAESSAQAPTHYFHAANLPPGAVGQGQLQRNLTFHGYAQPVEVLVPDGARVSVNVGGTFSEPQKNRLLAGMHVGYVYQLQISNIPYYEGFEIYPTIEVINRLYPPEGKALRFPVPIQFTQDEIELALDGRYVTRVVYLEDRESALPQQDDPLRQRYFEAGAAEDPLHVADRFGRPMLIMRMGSRVPDVSEMAQASSVIPRAVVYPPEQAAPVTPQDPANAVERQGFDVPRVSVPRIGIPFQPPFAVPPTQ